MFELRVSEIRRVNVGVLRYIPQVTSTFTNRNRNLRRSWLPITASTEQFFFSDNGRPSMLSCADWLDRRGPCGGDDERGDSDFHTLVRLKQGGDQR